MKRAHVHEYGPIFINIETFRRCLICGFAVPITVVPPELRLNQDSRARAGLTEHSKRMERAMEVEEDSPAMALLVSEEARERLAAIKLIDDRNAQLSRAIALRDSRVKRLADAEGAVISARNLLALAVQDICGARESPTIQRTEAHSHELRPIRTRAVRGARLREPGMRPASPPRTLELEALPAVHGARQSASAAAAT